MQKAMCLFYQKDLCLPVFFCGGGGPETAIELYFVSKPNFQTDDIVTITGVFNLNSDDVEHFNYILKKCKGVLSK